MLSTPAPFPEVGSFALWIDETLPFPRAELVRIMLRTSAMAGVAPVETAMIALPNRIGSSGNRNVPLADLIDATPLTKTEEREMHDAQRDLRGRAELSRRLRVAKDRSDKLRDRHFSSFILLAELKKMETARARDTRRAGGSFGMALKDVA